MSDNITPPIVKKNRAPEEYFPLTTEEPVRRPWLRTELENINATDVDELENLTMGDDTSESSDDDSVIGKNKIKQMIKEEAQDTGDIMDCLAREMIDYEAKLNGETEEYEQRVANAETEGDILAEDPELLRRTENNRYIPFEEDIKPVLRVEPNEKNILLEKDLLVFSDQTATIEDTNRVVVVQYYGAGKSGVMPNTHHTKRKPKTYLVACDFSKESLYAMEWTMGAMMRDGDELHVATVANRDDNPEGVKATGLDQAGELHALSKTLMTEAKKLLGQMMLFNIKLVTHATVGRVKDVLKALTRETDYTLLVCGSRGRSSVRTLLMGSVSTYLVHKSPVPVAVIRRQKKKKRARHALLAAHSLSEGIKTGHLHVDELS